MPLFECSQCHVVENTAISNYWWDVEHEGKPALCSQCDPQIGKWHDEFPRTAYTDYVKRFGADAVQFPAAETAAKEPAVSGNSPSVDSEGNLL